jgi:hypothetical protein
METSNLLLNISNLCKRMILMTENIQLNKHIKAENKIIYVQNEKLFPNRFMCKQVEKYVSDNKFYKVIYDTKLFNISLYFVNSPKDREIQDIIRYIINIALIVSTLSSFRTPIKITIIFTPFKKQINYGENKLLDVCNINSGVSIKYDCVLIWREEEWKFILIHELVHCYGLDDILLPHYSVNEVTNYITTNYKISGPVLPAEAFDDAISTIIYVCYFNLNIKDIIKKLHGEVCYSIHQISKLFKHITVNDINQLNKKSLNNVVLKQQSDVFSYFILKTALLFEYELFCNYVITKNKNKYASKMVVYVLNNKRFINVLNKHTQNIMLKTVSPSMKRISN